jgi:hypothetical protein
MGKQVKYIFGMAKSCLDLKGAKSPKLELDFLRLLVAIDKCKEFGEDAVGYLLVMNEEIAETVKSWNLKYDAQDKVRVEVAKVTEGELKNLSDEKIKNRQGMVDGSMGKPAAKESRADFGKSFGENYLKELILRLEDGVKQITDKKMFPLKVNWDFYGIKN